MRLAQRGFTYLAILLAVAIAGAGLAATGVLWSVESQRARERELLWVGAQYRNALQSYSRQGTVGGRLPRSLEDLVRDPRTADVRRHIRRLYPDPLTGSAEWGLIRVADGGIIGVYSLSERAPIKRAHFPPGFEHFEGAERFADWKFLLDPRMVKGAEPGRQRGAPGAQPPAGGPAAPSTPAGPGELTAPSPARPATPATEPAAPARPGPYGDSPFVNPFSSSPFAPSPAGPPAAPRAPAPAPLPAAPAGDAADRR